MMFLILVIMKTFHCTTFLVLFHMSFGSSSDTEPIYVVMRSSLKQHGVEGYTLITDTKTGLLTRKLLH